MEVEDNKDWLSEEQTLKEQRFECSPHKLHGLWLAVMLLLVFGAGAVSSYILMQNNRLADEMGAINDHFIGHSPSNNTRIVYQTVSPENLVALQDVYLPFSVKYPFGWFVDVNFSAEGPEEPGAPTRIVMHMSRTPFADSFGHDLNQPNLIFRSQSGDIDTVIANETSYLKNVKQEQIDAPLGTLLRKVSGDFTQPGTMEDFKPTVLYFFPYLEVVTLGGDISTGKVSFEQPYVMIAYLNPIYSAESDDLALLESIMKSVVVADE